MALPVRCCTSGVGETLQLCTYLLSIEMQVLQGRCGASSAGCDTPGICILICRAAKAAGPAAAGQGDASICQHSSYLSLRILACLQSHVLHIFQCSSMRLHPSMRSRPSFIHACFRKLMPSAQAFESKHGWAGSNTQGSPDLT